MLAHFRTGCDEEALLEAVLAVETKCGNLLFQFPYVVSRIRAILLSTCILRQHFQTDEQQTNKQREDEKNYKVHMRSRIARMRFEVYTQSHLFMCTFVGQPIKQTDEHDIYIYTYIYIYIGTHKHVSLGIQAMARATPPFEARLLCTHAKIVSSVSFKGPLGPWPQTFHHLA